MRHAIVVLPMLLPCLGAQEVAVARARVAWLGRGPNPVVAECCVSTSPMGVELPAAGNATPQRLPLGNAAALAQLHCFPGFEVGKTKVAAGSWCLALQRTADTWSLLLIDPQTARAADPVAAVMAAAVGHELPLQAAPRQDRSRGLHCQFVVQQPGQKDDEVPLVVSLGDQSFRVTLRFPGMKSQPFVPEGKRPSTTLRDKGLAIAVLDHGDVAWSPALAKAMSKLGKGDRWRLGCNWWTTLEARWPLQIAGVEVPAGSWHAVLVRGKTESDWQLCLLDAADNLKGGLDAIVADKTKGGLLVPMAFARVKEVAPRLAIHFVDEAATSNLQIAFGELRLTARVTW